MPKDFPNLPENVFRKPLGKKSPKEMESQLKMGGNPSSFALRIGQKSQDPQIKTKMCLKNWETPQSLKS